MKRKRYTRILIAVLLLLTMTLPILLTSCSSNTARSTADIPDGWEVVSKEGNVTHLRVKEGSDAYRWMDCGRLVPQEADYYFLDLELAGNPNAEAIKPDENGNVTVIVYYGYMKVNFSYTAPHYTLSTDLPDADKKELQLRIIRQWDLDQFLFQFDGLTTENSVLFKPHPTVQEIYDTESRIGFTRAILAEIPLSYFTNGWDTTEFCITHPLGNSYAIDEYVRISTCKFNDILFFSHSSLSAYLNSFPYSLLTKYSVIINATLFLSAFVLMFICTIKKKSPFIHLIPCALGIVYVAIAITYQEALPTPDHMFGGFANFGATLRLYAISFAYAVWAIILLIARWIINFIRRKRCQNSPPKFTSSDPQ